VIGEAWNQLLRNIVFPGLLLIGTNTEYVLVGSSSDWALTHVKPTAKIIAQQ